MSLWLDFMGAQIRYVQTPGFGRVRIAEAGQSNPEALFLMHGIGGHLEAYAKNLLALSEHYHVIAFDFVGHGYSEKKTDLQYTANAYAEQLREVMDVLAIEQAHIQGESLGGIVAGKFVVRYPDRVLRVVLNTAGGIPIVTQKGKQDLKDLAALSKQSYATGPTFESVQARMRWLFNEKNWDLVSDELVSTRLKIYTETGFSETAPLVYQALGKPKEGDDPNMMMIDLENLPCETLFLWTRENPIHDLESAKQACARVPQGQLYVMEAECGHWPQYEAPAEFNQVMVRFLSTGQA
ncbi:MAG: hypothetical protein DRQ60_10950 [Gammaproteobacteria bacterium]|nr:MAG: hypothetical protein DRQ60_10950 [Gammaproteobacteria bacterium]